MKWPFLLVSSVKSLVNTHVISSLIYPLLAFHYHTGPAAQAPQCRSLYPFKGPSTHTADLFRLSIFPPYVSAFSLLPSPPATCIWRHLSLLQIPTAKPTCFQRCLMAEGGFSGFQLVQSIHNQKAKSQFKVPSSSWISTASVMIWSSNPGDTESTTADENCIWRLISKICCNTGLLLSAAFCQWLCCSTPQTSGMTELEFIMAFVVMH